MLNQNMAYNNQSTLPQLGAVELNLSKLPLSKKSIGPAACKISQYGTVSVPR